MGGGGGGGGGGKGGPKGGGKKLGGVHQQACVLWGLSAGIFLVVWGGVVLFVFWLLYLGTTPWGPMPVPSFCVPTCFEDTGFV